MCRGYEIFGLIEQNNFDVSETYSRLFHIFMFDPQILPSSEFIDMIQRSVKRITVSGQEATVYGCLIFVLSP